MSITEGFQVPVIPLSETVGKTGIGVVPEQNDGICCSVNTGMSLAMITTFNVVGSAHWPGVGVNIYTVWPTIVLSIEALGDHVPVIVLTVVGKASPCGGAVPSQNGMIGPYNGMIFGVTSTLML